MPVFTINTNLPADKIPAGFLEKTSKIIASSLGKPESYVSVVVNAGLLMTFGGSSNPCAVCSLESIGGVGGGRNNSHAAKLYPHLQQSLGLSGSRIYIHFVNIDASSMAYDGSTFA
uniref:L-dopachrome isomerase n=1 Tax=Syphacia muris TaxID=451379 RepID=A0A0N5AJ47_9BILA